MSHAFNHINARLPSKYFPFLITERHFCFFFFYLTVNSMGNWQYAWLTRGHGMRHMTHTLWTMECCINSKCVSRIAHTCMPVMFVPTISTDRRPTPSKRETCVCASWKWRMDGVYKYQMDIDSRSIRMRFAFNVWIWDDNCARCELIKSSTVRIVLHTESASDSFLKMWIHEHEPNVVANWNEEKNKIALISEIRSLNGTEPNIFVSYAL